MATLQAAPPGTATINWSVEYLPTNTLFFSLPGPELKREGGRAGKKHCTKIGKQATRLHCLRFAKNCKQATAYISHKVPLLKASG